LPLHRRHKELASVNAEITHAIDMAERYRGELANPEAQAKWQGIWLSIEVMLEWLFEEEARLCREDWLVIANAHAMVMEPVRVMIDLCKSRRAHRRANLSALDDIVLMLVVHNARYDTGSEPPGSGLDRRG